MHNLGVCSDLKEPKFQNPSNQKFQTSKWPFSYNIKVTKGNVLHIHHFVAWWKRMNSKQYRGFAWTLRSEIIHLHVQTQCKQSKRHCYKKQYGVVRKSTETLGTYRQKISTLSFAYYYIYVPNIHNLSKHVFSLILFHVLSWERSLGSNPCSLHGESMGSVLCTSLITITCPHHAFTVTVLYFVLGQEGLWQPPALLDHFLLLGTVHRHQMDLSVVLKETAQ